MVTIFFIGAHACGQACMLAGTCPGVHATVNHSWHPEFGFGEFAPDILLPKPESILRRWTVHHPSLFAWPNRLSRKHRAQPATDPAWCVRRRRRERRHAITAV